MLTLRCRAYFIHICSLICPWTKTTTFTGYMITYTAPYMAVNRQWESLLSYPSYTWGMCAISYIELSILTLHVNNEKQGNDNSVFKRLERTMIVFLWLLGKGRNHIKYKLQKLKHFVLFADLLTVNVFQIYLSRERFHKLIIQKELIWN